MDEILLDLQTTVNEDADEELFGDCEIENLNAEEPEGIGAEGFVMRTSKPSNNPYYITSSSGGYSYAIKGKPTDPNANVLSNCVGFANGRYAEIQNKGKIVYQLVCNAENFIEKAKQYGLKVQSKPSLGGIMVWQKGATLSGNDGAGHVAIVERIIDSNTIYTSESNYGGTAFLNVTRKNTNGRWGIGSAYKYRGCIVNPDVKPIKIVGVPVPRDKTKNQLEVITDTLRARKDPSLKGDILGYVKTGVYNILNTAEADGYTWYQIDEFWCANNATETWCHVLPKEYVGSPVERDTSKDQLEVITKTLRARKDPSLNGEVLGYVNTGLYNVSEIKSADGYTWYNCGEFWCANNSSATWCNYFPKLTAYNLLMLKLNKAQKDAMIAWCKDSGVEYSVEEI